MSLCWFFWKRMNWSRVLKFLFGDFYEFESCRVDTFSLFFFEESLKKNGNCFGRLLFLFGFVLVKEWRSCCCLIIVIFWIWLYIIFSKQLYCTDCMLILMVVDFCFYVIGDCLFLDLDWYLCFNWIGSFDLWFGMRKNDDWGSRMYWTNRWLIDVLSGLIVEYDGWSILGDYAVSDSQLMSEEIDLMDDLFWRPPLESEVIDLMDDWSWGVAKKRGNLFGGLLISGDRR